MWDSGQLASKVSRGKVCDISHINTLFGVGIISSPRSLCGLYVHAFQGCFACTEKVTHEATQGLYSLSGKTSYRKISWSLEAARFGFKLFQSLWNLAGTSAALLPRCLSNFRAIRPLQHPISRLRDFTRFGGKTSYRLVNRGPDDVG